MSEEAGFREFLRRVRAGDPAAAEELVRRYEPAIRRSVRRPLGDMRLRHLLDATDICQTVLANFFFRVQDGQFELARPEELLSLLLAMARNQLLDEARRQRAGRRDHQRRSVDLLGHGLNGLCDDEPTPSRLASARELIEEVSRRLSDEERELLEQRALGREWADVAAERGGTASGLRKKLGRALERILRDLRLDESEVFV